MRVQEHIQCRIGSGPCYIYNFETGSIISFMKTPPYRCNFCFPVRTAQEKGHSQSYHLDRAKYARQLNSIETQRLQKQNHTEADAGAPACVKQPAKLQVVCATGTLQVESRNARGTPRGCEFRSANGLAQVDVYNLNTNVRPLAAHPAISARHCFLFACPHVDPVPYYISLANHGADNKTIKKKN